MFLWSFIGSYARQKIATLKSLLITLTGFACNISKLYSGSVFFKWAVYLKKKRKARHIPRSSIFVLMLTSKGQTSKFCQHGSQTVRSLKCVHHIFFISNIYFIERNKCFLSWVRCLSTNRPDLSSKIYTQECLPTRINISNVCCPPIR